MVKNTSDRIKELSLDMLTYFDKFCKDNDLRYMISFGTALGAVRHGGFIPWDDDVDVDMPIEDYMKLVKAWKKNGDKEKYFLQTKKTDPWVSLPFFRIRMNNATWIEPDREKYPQHWGIDIDIFPVYHTPRNKFFRKVQIKLDGLAKEHCAYSWLTNDTTSLKAKFEQIITLLLLYSVTAISFLSNKSEYIFYPYGGGKKWVGKLIWMFPTKVQQFEQLSLPGPADPDAYLSWQYGDYMTPPPEDKRGGHPVGLIDLENGSEKYTGVVRRNK